MSAWNCEDCRSEVIGKIRRGRCEPCYRKQLRKLRKVGRDAAAPPRKYRPRRKVIPKLTATEKVFKHTTPGWGGCILYTGRLNAEGYGTSKLDGRPMGVHRRIYLNLVGEIPDGMMLDHICHTSDADCPGGPSCPHRRCVNPNHMEPVTPAENTIRGRGISAHNFLKAECVRGHPFTPENTYHPKRLRSDGMPRRQCRECKRIRRARNRQSATAR